MSYFKESLKEIMQINDLKTADVAKLSGVSERTLRDLKNFNPNIFTALKIVDAFESSLDYFEKKTDVFKSSYNKDYSINFAENLNRILKEQNISYYKLGKSIGISDNTVSRLKQGKNLPSYSTLVDIANFLDCSIDELVGRKHTVR